MADRPSPGGAFARRQEAMRRITADVARLIDKPRGSVEWTATQRDLVEMIDLAWMQRTLTDRRGVPYSRRQLARLAFGAAGLALPRSLERVVTQIRERATPDLSILRRYEHLIDEPNILARLCQPRPNTASTF